MKNKEQRLLAMKIKLKTLLPKHEYANTMMLMEIFILVFNNKRRHDNTGGFWKRLVYKLITSPVAVVGYLLDIHVNSEAGKRLFGKYAKFGTLTATLKRVKTAWEGLNNLPTKDEINMAIQICQVLNDYDENGHC